MKTIQAKIKLLFLPYLVIAISFVGAYTFLNWLLIIELDLVNLKEPIINFWLPFLLPWLPVLIWLRPRIKQLRLKNDNAAFGYQFLAVAAMAFPTIVAQQYLSTATGKLTQLESISQFAKKETTKYYKLDNYFIDKEHVGVVTTSDVSGKYNADLNLKVYIALPILNVPADSIKHECSYFLGKKYSKTISNRLSDQEKENRFQSFTNKCKAEFDTTNFQQFVYLEKLWHSDDEDEFEEALKKCDYVRFQDPTVFISHTEAFEKRNGDTFDWIFFSFGIGALAWFVFLLFPKLNEPATQESNEGEKTTLKEMKDLFDTFIPRQGYFITPIIMNLNLVMYLVMVFAGLGIISFEAVDLLHWGGNYRPSTTKGEWWRLLTSVFLHGGLMHLIANMAGLLFVGTFLEPVLGPKKYLAVYLITGIIASATSLWWHTATVSIGASGAIFGLYGTFLAFLLTGVFPKELGKAFLVSTILFVGYNLLMGLMGGIDNAAHIGGLVSGFLIGLVLVQRWKTEPAIDRDVSILQ